MTASTEELLSEAQRARRGTWSAWRTAPPVTASDIRRWAIAVYWPEPPPDRYLEAGLDVASYSGRLVAPQEFNPFAWSPGGPPRTSLRSGVRRVLGGCRIRYGAPIALGDVIRGRTCLDNWTPKRTGTGDILLVDYHHEWRNQDDESVRDAIYTLVLRGPSSASC